MCQDSSASQLKSGSYIQGHSTWIFLFHYKLSKAQFKTFFVPNIMFRSSDSHSRQIDKLTKMHLMGVPSSWCIFSCPVFYDVAFEQSGGNSLRFLVLAGIPSSVGLSPFRHRPDSILDNYPRVLISPLTCRLPWATPLHSLFCAFPSLYSGLGMGQ